jgi:hypothetical protein
MTMKEKRIHIAAVSTGTTPSGRDATELILAYLKGHGMQNEYNNILHITENPDGAHLPPLDPSLAPGNLFNQDTATKLLKKPTRNDWVKMPAWIVGMWLPQENVVTHTKNEVTGQEDNIPHSKKIDLERMRANDRHNAQIFGYFPSKDAWWHYPDTGIWKKTEEKDHYQYVFEQQKKYEQAGADADKIIASGVLIVFNVDRGSNKIKSVVQTPYTTTAKRIADDRIEAIKDSKLYSYRGGLIASSQTAIYLHKEGGPIVRTKTESGQDATKLLFTFLLDHKMDDEAKAIIVRLQEKQMHNEAENAKKVLEGK